MTYLYYYNVSDYQINDLYKRLPDCFCSEEKEKIQRYRKESDQKRSLIAKIAVSYHLAQVLRVEEKELTFNRDKYDRLLLLKPFNDNLDFNISHSGDLVLLGINNQGRIGVDVEKKLPIDLEISKNVFVDEEIIFMNHDKKNVLNNFYQLWTLKESFVKAIGEGLSFPLMDFHFEFKNNEIIHLIKKKKSDWRFKTYDIYSEYKTAICLNSGDFPETVNSSKLF